MNIPASLHVVQGHRETGGIDVRCWDCSRSRSQYNVGATFRQRPGRRLRDCSLRWSDSSPPLEENLGKARLQRRSRECKRAAAEAP